MIKTKEAALKLIPKIEIQLVREPRAKNYEPWAVRTPEDINDFFGWLETSDREQFVAIMLNAKHEIIGMNVVSVGTLSASLVHPREVFKPAILTNAHAVAFAHNHPTGNTTPSTEDITTTEQLIKAGKILGINVIDHVIVGDDFYSIRENSPELWV